MLKKYFASYFAVSGVLLSVFTTLLLLPEELLMPFYDPYFVPVFLGSHLVPLVVCLPLAFFWHRKSKSDLEWSNRMFWMTNAITRYYLAMQILTYAFAKILKTQFGTSYFNEDTLIGNASGFLLTWVYFGYSYAMACTVASIQIVGSLLLLFRRTVVAGCMLLLPVMLNIVLINVFYDIDPLAMLNACMFTIILIYLSHERMLDFIKFIFQEPLGFIPKRNTWLAWTARVMVVAIAFMAIANFVLSDNVKASELSGKWVTKKMVRNNVVMDLDSWIKDTTIFSKVYFDNRFGGLTVCSNPYVYEVNRSLFGSYQFKKEVDSITGQLYANDGKDTLQWNAQARFFKTDSVCLSGTLGKDTLLLWLVKLPSRNNGYK